MTGFWNFLIFSILSTVLISILLKIKHEIAKGMTGSEAGLRNLNILFAILLTAIIFLSLFVGQYLLEEHSSIIFPIFLTIGVNSWLLSWFFRKQAAGVLLLKIGRTLQHKIPFWLGLFWIALLSFATWGFFDDLSQHHYSSYADLVVEISFLAQYWSLAIWCLALGLSKLEFRNNGICFMFSFIAWQWIKSYTWKQSKPNTLTIRLKGRYPLLSGSMSMTIPTKHQDAVSHILNERLPDKNL